MEDDERENDAGKNARSERVDGACVAGEDRSAQTDGTSRKAQRRATRSRRRDLERGLVVVSNLGQPQTILPFERDVLSTVVAELLDAIAANDDEPNQGTRDEEKKCRESKRAIAGRRVRARLDDDAG